ncbi:ferritin-like domain-containing protein [Spirosoma sp. KUDC1026]|uniref:YciE/YciF ferroxidase family protein n=1 Tax=Spirosoma sp. KUDC1026 TaxID=2745947 RepID=UPI00159BAF31|nr:ferritin-like domain-containing protein [Spirosoma sp. KUDC1026]QKZ13116.1 ferritin-like domain-containing protein [Spirosoma sp. KUDC1026]
MASLTDRIADFFSGNDSSSDEGLRDLFISELKSIYYVEKKIVDALGEQADASTTDEVRNAFLQHQEESRVQVERLEEIFRIISIATSEHTTAAINGLIDDAESLISTTETGSLTRDAGLIIAAQKIEHYEIATYGSLLTLADVLGFDQSAELLAKTLEEEKAADHKLTALAETFVNRRAKDEDNHPGSHHASREPIVDPQMDVTAGGPLGV